MEEEAHGVIIVGGGICGLATSLALHRKGIASLLLERSETLRADGAAIGVYTNGWKVLEQLGIAAELRETANLITGDHDVWKQRNKTGQSQVPIRKEFRSLKRKDLIETMTKNIPAGAIRFGCHVVAIHQDPSTHATILTTADGSTIRAKVLIGCDGGRSVVAKYLGLSAPKTDPRTILRGFTAYPHGHAFAPEFLKIRGDDLVVGRMLVTHNLVHFFVDKKPIMVTKDVSDTKDSMLKELRERDYPSEIIEMVRNSDPESLNVVNNLWYRPPWQVAFGTMRKGSVTVAGDAMHAMAPLIGQGGASGLEDAIVLARTLSRARATAGEKADYSVAIEEYVRERRLRVTMLSLECFALWTLSRPQSWLVTKLACVAVLALLGSSSQRPTMTAVASRPLASLQKDCISLDHHDICRSVYPHV